MNLFNNPTVEETVNAVSDAISALERFAQTTADVEGTNPFELVVLRDRLFQIMLYISAPTDWPVELVEVMSVIDHYMSKGLLNMADILDVIEPDQLALMSEIIDAVDRSPEWGR